ncbi:MAG: FAD-dependent oxidoreductase, partial [Bacteroidetes bacterium]|nr:FAD-dependent oxidoreductase [Bacteroidota bacterium]
MDGENADILVIGAGIFGATAAVELSLRGHKVSLIDEGEHPHPLAATTDIS